MKLQHPDHPSLITSRNLLLQDALRPDPLPYLISEEYPLVLHPDSLNYSYCFVQNNQVIAHANLYPKQVALPNQDPIKIGVIGNVATHKDFRGQGLMKTLFVDLEHHARSHQLQGLILWSDLIVFYQKLGYTSFGQEMHFYLSKQKMPRYTEEDIQIALISSENMEPSIPHFIQLRQKTSVTLNRTPQEWSKLCQIPDTYIFLIKKQDDIVGYLIMGRGYDMAGVIHEWGCNNFQVFISAIYQLLDKAQLEECILLSPVSIDHSWKQSLKEASVKQEKQDLCLFKSLNLDDQQIHVLSDLFIWGLDSI